MKILIVEDEKKLAELIEHRLLQEHFSVDVSYDGDDGYYKASSGIYDLIILDIMLPYKDGFSILNDLRNNNINSEIILLTARSELDDKLKGFKLGANDYLTKPFQLEELVARVNVRLGITSNIEASSLSFGDILLDVNRKVLININTKEEIEVLCKEYLLLECLIKNKGNILSKEYIYNYVWGMDNDSISNNLEAYMSFLRRKLKAINSSVTIKASRGLGYKLEVYECII